MLKTFSRPFSKCGLMIAAALVVAPLVSAVPLVTAVEAADKASKPRQRAGTYRISALPSRVYWGQSYQLTARPPGVVVNVNVTFYAGCTLPPNDQNKLGTAPVSQVSDGVAQLRATTDKLHLGSNDILIAYIGPNGATTYCQTNVITVLPIAR